MTRVTNQQLSADQAFQAKRALFAVADSLRQQLSYLEQQMTAIANDTNAVAAFGATDHGEATTFLTGLRGLLDTHAPDAQPTTPPPTS